MGRNQVQLRRFISAVAIIAIFGSKGANPAQAQMPVVKVVVSQARMVDAPSTITLVGTVNAARMSKIGSESPGLVEEMPVRQGDRVESEGILCRLNDDILSHQLAEERARLESLNAKHEELVAGTRSEDLMVLKAVYDESVAAYDRWKFDLERIERLYEGSDSNVKEMKDARAEFLMAERRKIAAQAAYDKGVAGPRKELIAQAAHDVAAQEAVVRRLESDLAKTVIRAPFAGFVVQRLTEVGEWIPEGGQIVELAELDRVLVRVDAPEMAFPYLVVDEPARIHIDALQRSFEGRIKHVIPRADQRARTLPVEIEVDNKEGTLASGMFARATVRSGASKQMVGVPKDAVIEREGTSYVALAQSGEGGATMGMLVPVTVGASTSEWIAITSGNIQPGMVVLTRGNERMLPFPMPIEIVDEWGRPAPLPPKVGEGTTGAG